MAVLRTALKALTFRLDSSRAAANTIIRKRAALHGRTWSVPVRGKPAAAPTARRALRPSAIRPWLSYTARRRPVDHADTKRTQARTATLAIVV